MESAGLHEWRDHGRKIALTPADVPMLAAIKLLHPVIWAILAGSIVVLSIAGVSRRFRWAAILTALVLLECGVLAVNRGVRLGPAVHR